MFTTHFSMTTQPFCEKIPADLIMKDERLTQGLARLNYLLHSGNIALVYGQTGVGKSTLLKLFLSQIPQNQFLPIYVHFTHVRSSSLLTLIVSGLGEIPKHTKDRLFLQIMDKTSRQNLTPILLICEMTSPLTNSLPTSSQSPIKPPKAISVSSALSVLIFTPQPTQKLTSPGVSVAKKTSTPPTSS